MVAPMTRRQMCNSVTICNGSKSHKPFSINNCNGVTGVPHLTGLPPMSRMGSPERGQGSYLPVQSIRVIRGSNRQAEGKPPLPRVAPAASATLGQDPGQPPPPAGAQNQAEKALLVLATSGGAAQGRWKRQEKVQNTADAGIGTETERRFLIGLNCDWTVKADLEIGAPVSPFNPARPFYPHYHRCSEVRAPVAPQAPLCGASRGRALRTTPLCRGAVSPCDKGAAWTGTRREGQISFGLPHGEH
jgi:hypothetical protein